MIFKDALMSEATILEKLSAFTAALTYANLPEHVVASIKTRILDTLGICLAALELETSQMAIGMAAQWAGPEEATAVGHSPRLLSSSAAFVNGVLAHSLDFDDTHLPSILHPSASIIPATLAVGEQVNASTKDMIAAAAAGYEICVRTGMAATDRKLGNSIFLERGWHATSICGTLGAAAIAAKLYGLDASGIGHAIAIAASMSSGVIEGNRAGGSVKRLHCGWAAHSGIIAAQTARAGFTGPRSIFEGRFGFYEAFCGGNFDPSEITTGLGTQWCIPGIFYKPYPANHFTHAAVDAALYLRNVINIDDIKEIELRVAAPILRTIAEPASAKARPASGYQAQFSGPFVLATALLGGGLGVALEDFTDARVADSRHLELAAKVRCVSDPECDAIFPNQFPAIVKITTNSGAVVERRVMNNRGGPANPLSSDEIMTKFKTNVKGVLSDVDAAKLIGLISNLEESSIDQVMRFTT
jgi:2-methylcitrate dehydratase PrpD